MRQDSRPDPGAPGSSPRFSFGDVLLVPFPFTDQSGAKKRPAVLKPVFTTIEQGLVIRVMGHLSEADIKTLRGLVSDVIG